MLAEVAAPCPCTRHPGKQADQVASNPAKSFPAFQLMLNIGNHLFDNVASIRRLRHWTHMLFKFSKEIWMVVGLAADHDTIDMSEYLIDVGDLRNSAIQKDLEFRMRKCLRR